MISKEQYEWLQAQIGTVDHILESLPADNEVSRSSYEYQKRQLQKQLDANPPPEKWPARAVLHFDGEPVTQEGIDAAFVADAVSRFNRIFAGLASAQEKELASKGPFPGRTSHKLRITDVTRGSFGFQIEEIPINPNRMDEPSSNIEAALQETLDLLGSDKKDRDVDDRVRKSLYDFSNFLSKNGAQCKLSFNDQNIVVRSRPEVRLAPPSKPQKREFTWRGYFKGYLPSARQAEFFRTSTKRTIRGKVDPVWRNADEINNLLNRPVNASIIQTRLGKKVEYLFADCTLVD